MGNWDQVARCAYQKKYNKAYYGNKRVGGKYSLWRWQVLTRDKRTCLLCGSPDQVQAHHIKRWIHNPIERFKKENGATLCKKCHNKYHNNVGAEFPPAITQVLAYRASRK